MVENMIRPEAVVLADNALIPPANLISPPPNQFTHELTVAQPYYYSETQQDRPPDGTFAAGTKMVLLVYHGGRYCRVADRQGLYVDTEYRGLQRL